MRHVFFISDRTGITTEGLGRALLTQFEQVAFQTEIIPFVDSELKADLAIKKILNCYQQQKIKPLVLTTIMNPIIRNKFKLEFAFFIDFLESFIPSLEQELGFSASHVVGKLHGMLDENKYYSRMDAIDFSLQNDDGISVQNFEKADVILLGVSRVGKTPTCLYLAVNYGIKAVNYPLVEMDLFNCSLPKGVLAHHHKLFGLTIDETRLYHIRFNRLPYTKYAEFNTCKKEIQKAEQIMQNYNIPCLNVSKKSIEEIAASIMQVIHLRKQF